MYRVCIPIEGNIENLYVTKTYKYMYIGLATGIREVRRGWEGYPQPCLTNEIQEWLFDNVGDFVQFPGDQVDQVEFVEIKDSTATLTFHDPDAALLFQLSF